MNACVRRLGRYATMVAMVVAGSSVAHAGNPPGAVGQPQQAEPVVQAYPDAGSVRQPAMNPRTIAGSAVSPAMQPLPVAGSAAYPAMDPIVRALVIGIAANILREAAAQPDPVEALGNAVERRIVSALADPNTMRLVEKALQHAFQDAPVELREPLALFAASVLHNMRRDILQDRHPRPRY